MQLGMIGLGRMGANMVKRLHRARRARRAFDRLPEALAALNATALFEHFASRSAEQFPNHVLAATRFGFGGPREQR